MIHVYALNRGLELDTKILAIINRVASAFYSTGIADRSFFDQFDFFGLCELDLEESEIRYYKGRGEYSDVLPNDRKNKAFFFERDERVRVESGWICNMSAYFMWNDKSLTNTRVKEEFINVVTNKMNIIPFVHVKSVNKNDPMEGYSTLKNFTAAPFDAFRVDFELDISDDCNYIPNENTSC